MQWAWSQPASGGHGYCGSTRAGPCDTITRQGKPLAPAPSDSDRLGRDKGAQRPFKFSGRRPPVVTLLNQDTRSLAKRGGTSRICEKLAKPAGKSIKPLLHHQQMLPMAEAGPRNRFGERQHRHSSGTGFQ